MKIFIYAFWSNLYTFVFTNNDVVQIYTKTRNTKEETKLNLT